jgi:multidrug efflux pump subunit AcrA (membrane-fusion protein)
MTRTLCCLVALLVGVGGLLASESKPAKPEKAAAKEPAKEKAGKDKSEKEKAAKPEESSGGTHKVKREPLKIEVTLKGTLEAEKAAEIAVRPEVWATLEVVKAAEHGQRVKQGDVLIQFDFDKIDEDIADAKAKQVLSEYAFQQAAETLKALEATTPLDLKASERSREIAHQDLEKFLKKDRALLEKAAHYQLKSAEFSLENQRDELRQLEQMYKADDLTEETEQIVLKRQRRSVEAAEHFLEIARSNHDDTLKFELPRRQEALQQGVEKTDITAAKAKVTIPLALKTAQRDFEKTKIDRQREAEKLKKLEADRALLTVKSPIDGIVYYGRFARGKWAGSDAIAEMLRRGGTVTKNAVVMTVVPPRPLFVRCGVSEADLEKVKVGIKGTLQPAAFPDLKVPAWVAQIDGVPVGPDAFEARIQLTLDKQADGLVPGMTGTVKLVAYDAPNALVVPAKAVFAEDSDDEKKYVFLVKDGKPQKQPVATGKKTDDRIEILKGVSEGDEVLLEKPKEEEKKADAKPDGEKKADTEKKAETKKEPDLVKKPKKAKKSEAKASKKRDQAKGAE